MTRSKYSERRCAHCNKETRMEMVGAMDPAQNKHWFRCTRCHHMTLATLLPEVKESANTDVDQNAAVPYDPQSSFVIGSSIFHSEWNDFGKVMSKARMSDGTRTILVTFEKLGPKTLVENLVQTEPS